ncbi:hypothetical protein FORC51_p0124 (plasmid) [Salmonella enterica]|nr:hypothetical protein FORC51_p0124 [Salmonella enterica]
MDRVLSGQQIHRRQTATASARPVTGRTRHTGSGWQSASGVQEWPG